MWKIQKYRIRHFIFMLPVFLILSFLIKQLAWNNYLLITHTLLELLCVFMTLMMFVLVWYSYEKIPISFQLLGFCYFVIAVFLLLHCIYFQSPTDLDSGYSLEFIMIARIFEALAFFSFTYFKDLRVKKETLLVFSLGTSLLIAFILIYNGYLLILFTAAGYTKVKTGIEVFILAVLIFNHYKIYERVNDNDIIGYRYVSAAILIAIFSTIIFALQKHPDTYINIFGHVLRIILYYHIFKGVFVSAISHPYHKLEEILNHLPLAVTTYDSNFMFNFGNKKAEEITGYTLKQLNGITDSEIIKKLYQDKNSNHLVRELSQKHNVSQAVRTLIHKDGNPMKIVIEGFKLESGGYLCVFDTARRIQAFENMQLQTQAILNSISNFVIMVDTDEKVIMCNKALSVAIQMEIKDIIGSDIFSLIKKIHFSKPYQIRKKFFETQFNIPLEASIETPDGEKKDLLLHLAYIRNIEQEVMGYIAVGSDITEIKRQQEEVKQKEKLAILGQMASGIVHEIRNPITAIMGFNQLLKMNMKDEKVDLYCQHIENELNRLNKIVSDFLLFARPRNPVFAELFLKDIVESMNLLIDSYVFSRGIKLIYEFKDNVQPVYADKNQLEQVILNIVKNAVDAVTDVSEPLIRISTGFDDLFQENYLIIYNNGKALDQEQKLKIGTPFFTTKSHGTGLGLSICNQIIKDHGGKIAVKSEEDWGTAFELSFPATAIKKASS